MKLQTPKQLGITSVQRRNLAKLILFVHKKVKQSSFDIKYFFINRKLNEASGRFDAPPSKQEYVCGTAACFLGCGILAGIKVPRYNSWNGYAFRKFGAGFYSDIFKFLFDAAHLNSKIAAVKRGAWFLQHGLPHVTSEDLFTWEAPKNFKPNWEDIKKLAN